MFHRHSSKIVETNQMVTASRYHTRSRTIPCQTVDRPLGAVQQHVLLDGDLVFRANRLLVHPKPILFAADPVAGGVPFGYSLLLGIFIRFHCSHACKSMSGNDCFVGCFSLIRRQSNNRFRGPCSIRTKRPAEYNGRSASNAFEHHAFEFMVGNGCGAPANQSQRILQ